MKPILNDQIVAMDEARMQFITALNEHIVKLRDELKISELIMHSVVKSLSTQDDVSAELDEALTQLRKDTAHHKPLIQSANKEDELEETLRRVARDSNLRSANSRDN